MADQACPWGTVDREGRYPCTRHKGGFLEVGATYCSKAPGLWAETERYNRKLQVAELTRTREELEKLGVIFTGFVGAARDTWEARVGPQCVRAASGAELVRKVRQALKLEPGPPRQEVLW